jgi:hypothetical protein
MAKGAGKGQKGATPRILTGVNIFFLVAGIIVLACGIVAASSTQDFRSNADIFRKTNINAGATTVLVCGAVTIFATFVGFLGIVKANIIVMKMYIVLIGVTICMQLAMGSFIVSRDIDSELSDWWFGETDQQAIDDKDNYQQYLGCCGWYSLRDSFGAGMPLCALTCYDNPGTCPGCLHATEDWIDKNVVPGSVGAIIIACVEFLVIIAPCYLIMIMKKDKDDFFEDAYHY